MMDGKFGKDAVQGTPISPYASSLHNRGIGHGVHLTRKQALFTAAPLLLIGVTSAVTFATFSNSHSDGSKPKASQTAASSITTQQKTASPSVESSDPAAPTQTSGNTTNMNAKSTSTESGNVTTSVTVNGQPVDVPTNGTVSDTTTNPDGSVSSYSVSNSTNGSSNSYGSSTSMTSVTSNSSSWNSNAGGVHGTTIVNGVPYSY